MNNNIHCEVIKSGICVISLESKPINALSFDFLNSLKLTFLRIHDDKSIRIVILKSNLKHFSAGADLKERKIMSNNDASNALDNFNDCFNVIDNLNKPTICLINGYCLGGGAELALAFDFRIGANNSIIGFPEVGIGIIPGAGGTYRLPKIIGQANAKYWIYTAKKFNADESLKYGYLHFMVPNEDAMNVALDLSNEIIKNAPIAVMSAKKAINESYNKELETGLAIERKNYSVTLNTKDRDEALDAFLSKRKPVWKNE